MASDNKSDIINKIAMGGFSVFILLFVILSSGLYFNNSNNIAIKIQIDNEVNREKTAVNEALTKTLVMINDSIVTFKTNVQRKDSLYIKTIEQFQQVKLEKDSLARVLRSFKQSDTHPVTKTNDEMVESQN
jgi:hypothetical protein